MLSAATNLQIFGMTNALRGQVTESRKESLHCQVHFDEMSLVLENFIRLRKWFCRGLGLVDPNNISLANNFHFLYFFFFFFFFFF